MKIGSLVLCLVISGGLVVGSGCRKKDDHAHGHDDHGHDHSGHSHAHGHHHEAPHGGTAVVLGEEAYHLEFVHDAKQGTLTAYILDGHMENFIRTDVPAFSVEATVDGKTEPLVFAPVANAATSETVGDTSQFVATAEWLKRVDRFDAKLVNLTIRGTRFENVAFNFPAGNEH